MVKITYLLIVLILDISFVSYAKNNVKNIFVTDFDIVKLGATADGKIKGEGTIDGSGDNEVFQLGNMRGPRPFLVQIRKSKKNLIRLI